MHAGTGGPNRVPYVDNSDASSYAPSSNGENAQVLETAVWSDANANRTYANYVDASFRGETFGALNSPAVSEVGPAEIAIATLPDASKTSRFKGRRNVIPGAILLLLIIGAGAAGTTYYGIQAHNDMLKEKQGKVNQDFKPGKKPLVCGQANFQVDGNGLVAVSPSGSKDKLKLNGVNWEGMNFERGVPDGLAFGQRSVYDIAEQLVKDKINAVRLPLSAQSIDENKRPDTKTFIDPKANVLLSSAKTYVDLIKEFVKALGTSKLGVVLNIFNIDPSAKSAPKLWFSSRFSKTKMERTVATLAKELCGDKYWNIIGIDLFNEPVDGCWSETSGDTSCGNRDWQESASKMAQIVLKECPQWLVFVQGVKNENTGEGHVVDGVELFYEDWPGASISNASANPINAGTSNKVVLAPHFYSPNVFPQNYFFDNSTVNQNIFIEYENSAAGNRTLKSNVKSVITRMFGADVVKDNALVLTQYGGIYGGEDLSKEKTASRVLEYILEYMRSENMAGGFFWSIGPNTFFNWNAILSAGNGFKYGLFESDWQQTRKDLVNKMKLLSGSGPLKCHDV